MILNLVVNGRKVGTEFPAEGTLLDFLREEMALTGAKEGCVEGECGACTVLLDGRPIDSCLYAAHAASGREVTTVEAVGGKYGLLAPLQKALVEAGGVQCGFCTPGFVMTLTALLDESPQPSRTEVQQALAGNICRCTGYSQILQAVEDVIGAGT